MTGCENAPLEVNAEATVDYFVEQSTQNWLLSQTQSLALSSSVSVPELKEIIEQAESRTAVSTDNSQKYLQDFLLNLKPYRQVLKDLTVCSAVVLSRGQSARLGRDLQQVKRLLHLMSSKRALTAKLYFSALKCQDE